MSRPPRCGKAWTEEECLKLLEAVRRKETREQIASNHERTSGAIRAQLCKIAADYHMYENRSMGDIMKLTGLTSEEITDAIGKRKWDEAQKKKKAELSKLIVVKNNQLNPTQLQEPKKEGMLSILIEIRDLMKEMVELQKKNLANDAPPSAPESPPWKAHPHPNSPRAEYTSQ